MTLASLIVAITGLALTAIGLVHKLISDATGNSRGSAIAILVALIAVPFFGLIIAGEYVRSMRPQTQQSVGPVQPPQTFTPTPSPWKPLRPFKHADS